jgi:hypothetical protein
MKSILMATQFSAACQNATNYAVGLAKQMKINKLILFNNWNPYGNTAKEIINSVFLNNILKETNKAKLKAEFERVKSICPSHIEVVCISMIGSIGDCFVSLCKNDEIAYIVVAAQDTFSDGGANSKNINVSFSQNLNIPLVLVPNYYSFNQVTKTMLLNNAGDLESTLESKSIEVFLDIAQPELEVVNFDVDLNAIEDANKKSEILNKPKVLDDVINDFASENQVQLIINFAKKSSTAIKSNIVRNAQDLVYKTRLPLMVMFA